MARRDPFESIPAGKSLKIPFPFVLEELAPLDPVTRPMFGALGVYVGERIVMILRDKGPADADSGVWLAFDPAQEAAVTGLLPRLDTIEVFRTKVAGWKKLSARSTEFEDDVALLCRLVLQGDERIGKVPNQKRPTAKKEPAAARKTSSPVARKSAAKMPAATKAAKKPAATKAAKTTAVKKPAATTVAKKPAKATAAKTTAAKKPAAKTSSSRA